MNKKLYEYLRDRGHTNIICDTEEEYRTLVWYFYPLGVVFPLVYYSTEYKKERTSLLIKDYYRIDSTYNYFGIRLIPNRITRYFRDDYTKFSITFKDFMELVNSVKVPSKYLKSPKEIECTIK